MQRPMPPIPPKSAGSSGGPLGREAAVGERTDERFAIERLDEKVDRRLMETRPILENVLSRLDSFDKPVHVAAKIWIGPDLNTVAVGQGLE